MILKNKYVLQNGANLFFSLLYENYYIGVGLMKLKGLGRIFLFVAVLCVTVGGYCTFTKADESKGTVLNKTLDAAKNEEPGLDNQDGQKLSQVKTDTKNAKVSNFVAKIASDKTLNATKSEDKVLKEVVDKAESEKLNQEDTDKAVKEYFNEKGAKNLSKSTQKIDITVKKELDTEKQKHYDKMKKVEDEIQKVGKYSSKSNYEKNIQFLLNNTTNLSYDSKYYYISGYSKHIKDKTTLDKMDKFLFKDSQNKDPNKITNALEKNSQTKIFSATKRFDRFAAKRYAEKYCGTNLGTEDSVGYNTSKYPVFQGNDCANFASQCLYAGGKKMAGTKYDDSNAWFCNTTDSTKLESIALSWRWCPAFKEYWKTRCNYYSEINVKNVQDYNKFINNVWWPMGYGDVIQLADEGGAPWHNVIVTSYWNSDKQLDIGYTAHTNNRLNQSLYQYVAQSQDNGMILLYGMGSNWKF